MTYPADVWREMARRLACALESLLDCEHCETGLQVTDEAMVEAQAALNARIRLTDKEGDR